MKKSWDATDDTDDTATVPAIRDERPGRREERERTPHRDRPRLRVISGNDMQVYDLPEKGELLIGRNAGTDIRVTHESVSRQHAVLRIGEKMHLEDLGSRNGTRIGSVALGPGEVTEIFPGDLVRIGEATLIIEGSSVGSRTREPRWPCRR